MIRACEFCGVDFPASPRRGMHFCSNSCAKKKPPKPTPVYECGFCGDRFEGHKRLYCNNNCARLAATERRFPIVLTTCLHCGSKFAGTEQRKFCNPICCRKFWKPINAKRRRAFVAGAILIESVSLDVVFARDQMECHLCDEPVERLDASLDHLIPLSLGGDHSYANISLAHRLCNSRRGNKPLEKQLHLAE